jgi:hypothetical protein
VFLERVIELDTVQRHRSAVRDEGVEHFFAAGRRPGQWGDNLWPLDEWPTPLTEDQTNLGGPPAWSPALKAAWAAAEQPWREFVAALRSGELGATGRHAASGVRGVIDPVEFARIGLVLDVHNGDVLDGKRRPLWTSLTLEAADDRELAPRSVKSRSERIQNAREKRQIVRDASARLIKKYPELETHRKVLAQRIERECHEPLKQRGHKSDLPNSWKTILKYLHD